MWMNDSRNFQWFTKRKINAALGLARLKPRTQRSEKKKKSHQAADELSQRKFGCFLCVCVLPFCKQNFQLFSLPAFLQVSLRFIYGSHICIMNGQSIHLGLIGLRMPFVSRKVSITMKEEQIFVPKDIHSVSYNHTRTKALSKS